MTIAPDHHEPFNAEPFSDEERELAARLGRIGPVEGPSPALDARILAAAHAASVPRRPASRRRFAWLGVPPALVTGVGVAAAAVLALGMVWQLRPQYGRVSAQAEADVGEEVILIAPPSDASAPQAADAAALPERVASPKPATRTHPQASPPAPLAASVPETASQAAASAAAPAPEATATDEAGSIAPSAAPEMYRREADESANQRTVDDGFVATPPDSTHRNATYTTAARAAAERRERSAAQKASAGAAAATASEDEGATLDRIEVTGSRIGADLDVDWSQVPVNDDTHLPSIEWLERIRARRDAGDADSARASLKQFQREYPRIRLPEDLRALLADTGQ